MAGKNKRENQPNRLLTRAAIPQATATACIRAANSPQRRRILRILHDAGEARSPNELAAAFGITLGHVSYHVKVLRECGALALTDTQQKRGAVEHFYASTVANNELVVKLLEATREDDE